MLKVAFLFLARSAHSADVSRLAFILDRYVAEQIFEAALADERIAFEVEEHVTRRGLRQNMQAEARLGLQHLVDPCACRTRFDLQPRLLTNALIGLRRAALRSSTAEEAADQRARPWC